MNITTVAAEKWLKRPKKAKPTVGRIRDSDVSRQILGVWQPVCLFKSKIQIGRLTNIERKVVVVVVVVVFVFARCQIISTRKRFYSDYDQKMALIILRNEYDQQTSLKNKTQSCTSQIHEVRVQLPDSYIFSSISSF